VRNACRGVMQRSVHAILMARNFVVILTSCSHQQRRHCIRGCITRLSSAAVFSNRRWSYLQAVYRCELDKDAANHIHKTYGEKNETKLSALRCSPW